jgi:hypothetical protein
MRRHQGYNISKIQPGITYFDNTSAQDTRNSWPQFHPYFFKFDPFSIRKWHAINNRNRPPCREKNSLSFETFPVSNCQMMEEKIAKYDQDRKVDSLDVIWKLWSSPICVGKSEWTNIWLFITTFCALSNEIFNFKI